MSNLSHRLRLALAATTALVAASPAWAQSRSFNVPAGPAQASIAEFARQADIQVVVSEADAEGRRTNEVKGQFDVATGLRLLLSGTGLESRATGEGTYSVVRAPAPASAAAATSGETVVVTARAGAEQRTRAVTSYSVSVIPQERLREQGISSVADSLRNVPGFWVENSGGEASANVRARGIPVDGYSSIQLEEDGMPIQHDPGLGYLNADQGFRLDESIDQVQVVRGGPSSVFAPNAPGGVVNYITRKPTDEFSGLAKATVGDDGLYRGDVWIGGPIGGGWKVAASGFYRVEEGVRDPGYNFNNGGQFRFDAIHDLGNGELDLDYKHIDDKVGFYLPIPVAATGNGGVTSVPGFNATTGILNGPETESLRLLTANGPITFNTNDGTDVKLNQFSAHFTQDLSGGWHVDDHFRYRDTSQDRIGLYTGSVQTGDVRLAQLLPQVQAAMPGVASLQLRYVDDGSVFSANQNGNGLEVDNNARDVSVSEREIMDDLKVSKTFDLFGQVHDVTLGGYIMSAHEHFGRYSAVLMDDVQNQARLLNVVALDAAGNVIGNVTDNGVLRYGSEYANGQGDQLSTAIYGADEWQVTDKLRIDGGIRYERMHTNGTVEGSKTIDLNQTSTLADTSYITGNGIFTPYSKTFDSINWTIGVNYQFDPTMGVFARATHAERMPSISDFITNAIATPVVNKTDMYEAGFKFSRSFLDAYVTAFDTEYHNYGVGEFIYDNATATYISQTYYADTRDYGLELDGSVRPTRWFELLFTGTVQQPTFTSLAYTTQGAGNTLVPVDYNGNQLLRIPKFSFSVSPTLHLLDDRLMLQTTVEHYSNRYADAANSQLLPEYTVLDVSLRFNIRKDLTFYLSGYNLTDTIGLTEGNPRSGEILSTQAGAPVYLARPILGRNFRMSLLYSF